MARRPIRPLIGVDVGGSKIVAALLEPSKKGSSLSLRVLARHKKKTKAHKGPQAVVTRLVESLFELLDDHRLTRNDVAGIGLGVPGHIDFAKGRVILAPNLRWRNLPLQDRLAQHFPCPIVIENDVNAGTWGEARLGAGRGAASVVGVFMGTGVGGGVVLNGKVWHGKDGLAGEIGHIMLDPEGPKCTCGRRGCMEAYAGKWALAQQLEKADPKGKKSKISRRLKGNFFSIGSREFQQAVAEGDRLPLKLLEGACQAVGMAIANTANVLNPDVFVLGGGMMESLGSWLLPRIRRAASEKVFPTLSHRLKIVSSRLKDDAVLLGAGLLAAELIP